MDTVMRMSRVVSLIVTLATLGAVTDARAQDPPPVRVNLSGRAQIQWNTTSVSEEDARSTTTSIAASTFEPRRIRLQANITVGDYIRAIIEPDFALSRLALKQAWIALDFDPAFSIRAGQFKKPFSLITMTSSTQVAPIERGVRIRNLNEALNAQDSTVFRRLRGDMLIGEEQALVTLLNYADYDIGAAVEGEKAGFGWSLGAFNGNGPDTRDENDSKSIAGRLTYELPLGTPVRVGASFSHRDLSVTRTGQLPETRTGTAYMADLEVGAFRRGVWLLAEVTLGDNLVTQENFRAAQAMLSYFHGTGGRRFEGVEPVARVSYGDPDDTIDGDEGILVTPGVNLYLFGRNRLMFNWDVFMPRGEAFTNQHALRAQLNLYF